MKQWSEQYNNFWKIDQMKYWQLKIFEKYMDYAEWRDGVLQAFTDFRQSRSRLAHWLGKGIDQMFPPPKPAKRYMD